MRIVSIAVETDIFHIDLEKDVIYLPSGIYDFKVTVNTAYQDISLTMRDSIQQETELIVDKKLNRLFTNVTIRWPEKFKPKAKVYSSLSSGKEIFANEFLSGGFLLTESEKQNLNVYLEQDGYHYTVQKEMDGKKEEEVLKIGSSFQGNIPDYFAGDYLTSEEFSFSVSNLKDEQGNWLSDFYGEERYLKGVLLFTDVKDEQRCFVQPAVAASNDYIMSSLPTEAGTYKLSLRLYSYVAGDVQEKDSQSVIGTISYSKTYGNPSFKLDATLEKGNGMLSYVSSNPKVAEVSSTGNVKIKGTGRAVITVIASETEEFEECKFNVSINIAKASQRISGTTKYSKTVGSKPFRLNVKHTVGDGKLSYLSSNRTVATVFNSGMVTVKKPGNTVITVTAAATANYNACTFRIKLSITAPKKGTALTDPKTKAKYKVTKQGKSVEYTKPKDKKATKVSIPATVTISGVKYNVTAIGANAFSSCKKLKTITIGKNVESIGAKAFANCAALGKLTLPSKASKIGKQAFSGCGKLKDITIKSTKLTSKSVGTKAFQGIHAKAIIKVPKTKKAAYQKLLKSKGIGKKAKVK